MFRSIVKVLGRPGRTCWSLIVIFSLHVHGIQLVSLQHYDNIDIQVRPIVGQHGYISSSRIGYL